MTPEGDKAVPGGARKAEPGTRSVKRPAAHGQEAFCPLSGLIGVEVVIWAIVQGSAPGAGVDAGIENMALVVVVHAVRHGLLQTPFRGT